MLSPSHLVRLLFVFWLDPCCYWGRDILCVWSRHSTVKYTAYTTYLIMLFNINNWFAFFLRQLSNIFVSDVAECEADSQSVNCSSESRRCGCCSRGGGAMLTLTLQRTVLYWVQVHPPTCCTNLHSVWGPQIVHWLLLSIENRNIASCCACLTPHTVLCSLINSK